MITCHNHVPYLTYAYLHLKLVNTNIIQHRSNIQNN